MSRERFDAVAFVAYLVFSATWLAGLALYALLAGDVLMRLFR